MPGIIPNEGKNLVARMVWKRDLADRDADLEIGLFTNTTIDGTTTLADLVEPTGGGYARKNVPDADTVVTGSTATHPELIFIAVGSAYNLPVYGYFVATKAAGGTPRLKGIEVDPAGPRTMAENASFRVGLSAQVP